jgi:triosephosphate isomerase (TIM)
MKLIVANWKMNPNSLSEAQGLLKTLAKVKTKHKVVVCPPFPYLGSLKTKIALGSQDLFWEDEGAYTGQVSGQILKQFGVEYAIIGHSESRAYGQTDAQVNKKIVAALRNKIIPILCVGYGISEQQTDEDVCSDLRFQLDACLKGIDPSKVIVAYEPVWAISSNAGAHAVSASHAEKIAMFIKIKFKVKKILYGGSVTATNYTKFATKEIGGLLVGASSLDAGKFSEILMGYK